MVLFFCAALALQLQGNANTSKTQYQHQPILSLIVEYTTTSFLLSCSVIGVVGKSQVVVQNMKRPWLRCAKYLAFGIAVLTVK